LTDENLIAVPIRSVEQLMEKVNFVAVAGKKLDELKKE
jgi:hypothetical protein